MTELPEIHVIVSAPFQENTYVVRRRGAREALVVDPGLEPDLILGYLLEQGLEAAAILDTHGHADHIAGNEAIKKAFPAAPLLIGRGDAPLLEDPWANLSAPFGMSIVSPPADRLLDEGEVLDLAGIRLEVREIPGHSPGHIVFLIRGQPDVVLGGDVLFQGSVGRTDFPGGSFETLRAGIHAKLFDLPDATIVLPGHGAATTVGEEKRSNPFVGLGDG